MEKAIKNFRPFVISIHPRYEEIEKSEILESINEELKKTKAYEETKKYEKIKKLKSPIFSGLKFGDQLPAIINIYFLPNSIINIVEYWPLTKTSFATTLDYDLPLRFCGQLEKYEISPKETDAYILSIKWSQSVSVDLHFNSSFNYLDKDRTKSFYKDDDAIIYFSLDLDNVGYRNEDNEWVSMEKFEKFETLFSIPKILLKPYYEIDEFVKIDATKFNEFNYEKYEAWELQCKELMKSKGIDFELDSNEQNDPGFFCKQATLNNKMFHVNIRAI